MTTASGADRWVICPTSEALPKVISTNEAAERGNHIHDFLRRVSTNPADRDAALASVPPEHQPVCAGIDVSSVLGTRKVVGVEQAYVLDVQARTFIYLGSNIGREYEKRLGRPLSTYEIPVTIDVETTNPVGEIDWKSGQYIPDIEERWQRRISAMVLSLKYDVNEVESANVYVDDDGELSPDRTPFNYLELSEFFDELVEAKDRVRAAQRVVAAGETPTVYPSPLACQYCPSKMYCPAKTALVKAAIPDLVDLKDRLSQLTPAAAGQAMLKVKELVKLGKEMEDALKEMARDHSLPADDGYEYRANSKKGKSYFDDAAARGLLITLGATQEQMKTLTKKGAPYTEVRRLKVLR